MAGGKETPRQKMIGLMYLVLTAMLALNVSKQILQGYLSVNESLEKSKKNLTESNKRIKDAFEATVNGNPASKPYYDEALIAIKEIEKEYKYLDEIKGDELVPARRPASLNGSIAELLLCYSLFSHTI